MIIIEKLKKEDLEEAISVYDDNHRLKTNKNKLHKVFDTIDKNPLYHNIVAKENNKIIGFATIIINYDLVEELEPFITVWNFGVREEERRKKVGTKMFEYIEDFAKDNHCSFISLIAEASNEVAQTFYESLGYHKEVGYVKMLNNK